MRQRHDNQHDDMMVALQFDQALLEELRTVVARLEDAWRIEDNRFSAMPEYWQETDEGQKLSESISDLYHAHAFLQAITDRHKHQ